MKPRRWQPPVERSRAEVLRDRRKRRISEIEAELAYPSYQPGPTWERVRAGLQRELDYLKGAV